jgi:nucleotide-binding universal stress UspA family protein
MLSLKCRPIVEHKRFVQRNLYEEQNTVMQRHPSLQEVRMLIKESNSVGPVIVQAAEAEECSAIILGCQGHGLRRAMLGSVSSYVLHHANIPVAVCQ